MKRKAIASTAIVYVIIVCKEINLEFRNDPKSKRYFEFGKRQNGDVQNWKNSELIKIQMNYVEKILFPPKKSRRENVTKGGMQ